MSTLTTRAMTSSVPDVVADRLDRPLAADDPVFADALASVRLALGALARVAPQRSRTSRRCSRAMPSGGSRAATPSPLNEKGPLLGPRARRRLRPGCSHRHRTDM